MKININTYAKVTLTDEGKRVYRPHQIRKDKEAPESIRIQLWEVMNIFGSECFNGANPVFVDNVIEIEEETR